MAVVQRISEQQFKELVFNDRDRTWELWDGVLREKPGMSIWHDGVAPFLGQLLREQLDRREYWVNVNGGKTRYTSRNYFVPDVVVIPRSYIDPHKGDIRAFNAYADPLPLVVEVWSPSTGDYDLKTKLEGYRQRGDGEIWFIHPHERTLTAWRRQPDGSYRESTMRGGIVQVEALPGVTVDFDVLLDW
jgi:Uma2 family endonuclease